MVKSVRDILNVAWEEDPALLKSETFIKFLPITDRIRGAVQGQHGPEPYRLFSFHTSESPLQPGIEDKANTVILSELDPISQKQACGSPPIRFVQRSALSANGLLVALSYRNGGLEVVHSALGERAWWSAPDLHCNDQHLPPLVWLEFVQEDSRVIGEDEAGTLWLLDEDKVVNIYQSLPFPGPECFAGVSPDRSQLVRASFQSSATFWPHNLVLIELKDDAITLRHLASPQTDINSSSQFQPRSLGFSPDGTQVGGFDEQEAHIWSTVTTAHVHSYEVTEHSCWTLNLCSTHTHSPDSSTHLSFYPPPPNSTDAARTGELQLSNEIGVISAVFIKIPGRPKVPESLYSCKFFGLWPDHGTIRYHDNNPSTLPRELIPLPSHPLRYTIDDAYIRMLVGGQTTRTSAYTHDDDMVYVPPVVVDLLLADFAYNP